MPTERPADFDAFWQRIDHELAEYPAAPELFPLPLRSTEFCTACTVKLTSIGPYRIFGYYSVPKGEGPFPAVVYMPRYGSVNHVPPYEDRQRYAVLQVMHRGQRLADQPFQASYPGLLTHGIDAPDTYIYRGIVADCIRGLEFILQRAEVDKRRVGIIGDDLALLTAARRPNVTAVRAGGLTFYQLLEACGRTDAYPIEEVNDYLRFYPDRREAITQTLAYFDPAHHAPAVTATTLLSVGDPGAIGGPEWLEPLTNALAGPVEHYRLTHEGGTDHDWIDAWLAHQLDTEPRPRMWEVG